MALIAKLVSVSIMVFLSKGDNDRAFNTRTPVRSSFGNAHQSQPAMVSKGLNCEATTTYLVHPPNMKDYQREFIEFALANDVLKFGTYTLKSGRVSPYFFNAGLFNSGKTLGAIGRFYAAALIDAGFSYDVLFGPAYKGIPLVCATALSLSSEHQQEAPFAFNRKEKKDHGEGGNIVGTPLKGKIVVVDDVITAGTAINESIQIIKQCNAELKGVLVAVDRAEVAPDGSGKSAIQAIEEANNIQIRAIITVDHIMEYMEEKGTYEEHLKMMREYKAQYGIKK